MRYLYPTDKGKVVNNNIFRNDNVAIHGIDAFGAPFFKLRNYKDDIRPIQKYYMHVTSLKERGIK